MKRKKWASLYVFAIFSVSACGPVTTPVPVLPTSASPSPVPPIFLSPTIVVAIPTLECNQNPPIQPKGSLVNIELGNQTGGDLNFSFGMSEPNRENECVTYSYRIAELTVKATKVLAGCYWGYGWIDGVEGPGTTQTDSALCLTNENTIYHVVIMKEAIALQ
jgi:hypothetical protein